jgi:hypothetical protein
MLKGIYNVAKWVWMILVHAKEVEIEAMHNMYGKKETDDKRS